MTATQTRRTADRLSYAAFAIPECRVLVEVTEHRPRAGDRVTRYVVEEVPGVTGGRLFLLAKDSDADPAVYEAFVGPLGRHACTCKGSACRGHESKCRHVLAVEYLAGEGAL